MKKIEYIILGHLNPDVDSIVKNNDAKDEDFFDDFFGSE